MEVFYYLTGVVRGLYTSRTGIKMASSIVGFMFQRYPRNDTAVYKHAKCITQWYMHPNRWIETPDVKSRRVGEGGRVNWLDFSWVCGWGCWYRYVCVFDSDWWECCGLPFRSFVRFASFCSELIDPSAKYDELHKTAMVLSCVPFPGCSACIKIEATKEDRDRPIGFRG